MQKISDTALLLQLKQGDATAFGQLYDHYWEKLFTYVMGTVRSVPDTEDIIQELFLSIWKRREHLEINSSLSTYLFASARYLGIEYIRRHLTQADYLQTFTTLCRQVEAPAAEMSLRIKELQDQLDAAARALPARMQEVFLLSRRHQLSQREIARELGISEHTVKKHIQQALKSIRATMDNLPGCLIFFFL